MTENREALSDLSERVALLVTEIEAGKAWGTVLLPTGRDVPGYGDVCGATLNEAEEALCVVVGRLRAENEQLREALEEDPSKWSFWTLVKIAGEILKRDYPAEVFRSGETTDRGTRFVHHLRTALAAAFDEETR